MSIALCLVVMCSTESLAEVPSWAKLNTQVLDGHNLTVVCNGIGPSLEHARNNAQSSCLLTASRYLNDKISIKAKAVETEKDAGYTEEISFDRSIKGLKCAVNNEEIQSADDSTTVWQKCTFDLAQAKLEETQSTEAKTSDSLDQSDFTKPSFKTVLNTNLVSKRIIKSNASRSIAIASTPQCDSITVETQGIIKCDTNPVYLTVPAETTKILIKARGYHPREITLERKNSKDTINVVLEPF